MGRTIAGAVIGAAVGLLLLTAAGAAYRSSRFGPELQAAWGSGHLFATRLWPLACPIGAFVGGVLGLESWLLRPEQPFRFPAWLLHPPIPNPFKLRRLAAG